MTFDLWDHQFCLACDKQVNVEGAAYCSESCRLADFERTSSPSSPSSQASSPGLTPSSFLWSTTTSRPTNNTSTSASASYRTKFYLSPAYDFSNAQPYGNTPLQQGCFGNYTFASATTASEPTPSHAKHLSPSISHSSLCSLQSTSTTSESTLLSDKAKKELRAYAVSLEQVRMQRRRSH